MHSSSIALGMSSWVCPYTTRHTLKRWWVWCRGRVNARQQYYHREQFLDYSLEWHQITVH